MKTILGALGVSQREFSRLIDMSPMAVSYWATGQNNIPGAVETILMILRDRPDFIATLREVRGQPHQGRK